MSVLKFDRPRAEIIFRELAHRWQNREAPFDTVQFVSPEIRHHPNGVEVGSREHALFLFFAAWLNRNGKTANKLLSEAKTIAEKTPWIIDPADPRSLERKQFGLLGRVIPFAHHHKYKKRIDWWYWDVMGMLRDCYDSDPRNIFLSVELSGEWRSDREQMISRLIEFYGVREKIAQLTICWFQEVDWPEQRQKWAEIRKIPVIATDMWVMRLMRQLNIVVEYETDIATAISSEISDFICELCFEEQISHTDLIQALWHTGAIICGQMRPRNAGQRGRTFCHNNCPAAQQCIGVVPANYITMGKMAKRPAKNGRKRTTTRLASMRWDELVPHPKTFHDLWQDPE